MSKRGPKPHPKGKVPRKPVPKKRTPEERLADWTRPRGPMTLKPKEWHTELARLLGAGWTVRESAMRIGVTEPAVYYVLRKAEADGRPIPRSVRSRKPHEDAVGSDGRPSDLLEGGSDGVDGAEGVPVEA